MRCEINEITGCFVWVFEFLKLLKKVIRSSKMFQNILQYISKCIRGRPQIRHAIFV